MPLPDGHCVSGAELAAAGGVAFPAAVAVGVPGRSSRKKDKLSGRRRKELSAGGFAGKPGYVGGYCQTTKDCRGRDTGAFCNA